MGDAILGIECYNVYARTPEDNLNVVVIEPGRFVRLDLDNTGEMENNVKEEDDRCYIHLG